MTYGLVFTVVTGIYSRLQKDRGNMAGIKEVAAEAGV